MTSRRSPCSPVAPSDLPMPDYEQPGISGEAPAEFALIDEFAASPSAEEVEAAPAEPVQQLVAPALDRPTPDCEQPEISGEAPAEFSLIGEPREPPVEPAVEASVADASPEPDELSNIEIHQDEPSPFVEAVADEPMPPPSQEPAAAIEEAASSSIASPPAKAPSWLDEPAPCTRRHPLRFMWQMDTEGRFSLGADEFTRLIGARTAAGFGRLWSEIAEVFDLDPDGRVLKAIANAASLPDSLAAATTAGRGLSAWSKQQEETIRAVEPVAERTEKNLISEIPDLISLSPEATRSWLSAIHPGAHITLPRSD